MLVLQCLPLCENEFVADIEWGEKFQLKQMRDPAGNDWQFSVKFQLNAVEGFNFSAFPLWFHKIGLYSV